MFTIYLGQFIGVLSHQAGDEAASASLPKHLQYFTNEVTVHQNILI